MGSIIPNMGMKAAPQDRAGVRQPGLADALFAKVEQRVLGVLFGNPRRSFYANEVIALARPVPAQSSGSSDGPPPGLSP